MPTKISWNNPVGLTDLKLYWSFNSFTNENLPEPIDIDISETSIDIETGNATSIYFKLVHKVGEKVYDSGIQRVFDIVTSSGFVGDANFGFFTHGHYDSFFSFDPLTLVPDAEPVDGVVWRKLMHYGTILYVPDRPNVNGISSIDEYYKSGLVYPQHPQTRTSFIDAGNKAGIDFIDRGKRYRLRLPFAQSKFNFIPDSELLVQATGSIDGGCEANDLYYHSRMLGNAVDKFGSLSEEFTANKYWYQDTFTIYNSNVAVSFWDGSNTTGYVTGGDVNQLTMKPVGSTDCYNYINALIELLGDA